MCLARGAKFAANTALKIGPDARIRDNDRTVPAHLSPLPYCVEIGNDLGPGRMRFRLGPKQVTLPDASSEHRRTIIAGCVAALC